MTDVFEYNSFHLTRRLIIDLYNGLKYIQNVLTSTTESGTYKEQTNKQTQSVSARELISISRLESRYMAVY